MATREEIRHALRAIFAARGIDPDIAERVVQQESNFNPAAVGDRGRSFGLAQLYTGGGLGNVAEKRGIDIRDPNQWRRHLEFMADEVAKPGVGWKPWYGARDIGISQFQGVGGQRSAPQAPTTVAAPAAPAPQTVANIQELQAKLLERYPGLRVTSGYRDPAHNARVGGARNSQHTHGRAIDLSLKGLDEATQRGVVEYARSLGARGLGYYPSNQSVHFDVRPGAPAAWGGNYSRTSLPGTPQWFQQIAQQHLQGKGVAPAVSGPVVASAGTANVKVPAQAANVTQGALAAAPVAPALQQLMPPPAPEPPQLTPPPAPPPVPDDPPPPMVAPPVDYAALMLPRIKYGLLGGDDYMGLLGVG